MIQIHDGDLVLAKEKYIAHQCNCITHRAAHLSKTIHNAFPYADVYTNRQFQDDPGTIKINGNGEDKRFVISMFGQLYPGKSKYPNDLLDGIKAREKYFHQCLLKIAKIENLESIAFPFKIGCGAAGGDWNYYYGTLINFANFVIGKYQTKVSIYRLDI
jgi:O-acetyl-ADP-ribose deacetylase (regulator of RNase III)